MTPVFLTSTFLSIHVSLSLSLYPFFSVFFISLLFFFHLFFLFYDHLPYCALEKKMCSKSHIKILRLMMRSLVGFFKNCFFNINPFHTRGVHNEWQQFLNFLVLFDFFFLY